MDVAGRTLLQRVLDRVRIVPGAALIVATSSSAEDDAIASHAAAENVAVFRGSLTDVADRALAAADAFNLSRFARVCADRPFVDPALIVHALEHSADLGADLVTTTRPATSPDGSPSSTVPAGLTTEVIRTDALRELIATTADLADREHVTRAFYRFESPFRHILLDAGPDVGTLPLVIDTRADLERARAVMARLGSEPHMAEVREVARTMASVVRE